MIDSSTIVWRDVYRRVPIKPVLLKNNRLPKTKHRIRHDISYVTGGAVELFDYSLVTTAVDVTRIVRIECNVRVFTARYSKPVLPIYTGSHRAAGNGYRTSVLLCTVNKVGTLVSEFTR